MSNFKFGIEKTSTLNADDFVTISKPGEYLHRVLAGGQSVESVFYPTLTFDEDDQNLKQVTKVLKRDSTNGSKILDWLAKIDLAIRKNNMSPHIDSKNVRSQFAPSKKWLYLIFDRANPDIVVKIAQYPWSVAKKLNELQAKLEISDPTKLRYGPTFVWDAIITHKYDPNKKGPEWQKHSYEVEVAPNSKFNGVFPAIILDNRRYPNPMNAIKNKEIVLKEEEWNAINNCSHNMDEILKPNSEEEILEQLTGKYPIYLEGTRDNVSIFPDPKALLSEMQESGYKAMISTMEHPQLPETLVEKEKEEKVELDPDKKVEEEEIIIEPTTAKEKSEKKSKEEEKEDATENSVLAEIQNELKKSKTEEKKEKKKKPEPEIEPESKEKLSDKIELNL
jgi:hypothetical protein